MELKKITISFTGYSKESHPLSENGTYGTILLTPRYLQDLFFHATRIITY